MFVVYAYMSRILTVIAFRMWICMKDDFNNYITSCYIVININKFNDIEIAIQHDLRKQMINFWNIFFSHINILYSDK